MLSTDLIGGPYRAPRCKVGRLLACRLRGDVPVDGITDAPIPWPYTRYRGEGVPRSAVPMIIICGSLEGALSMESSKAVAHHWGVRYETVSRWRRAVGAERLTIGTHRLLASHARYKLSDLSPETVELIRAKIAAGERNCDIARELDLHKRTICRIRRGRTFAEMPDAR